jgi:membrane-bound serine protease (ClpP class)
MSRMKTLCRLLLPAVALAAGLAASGSGAATNANTIAVKNGIVYIIPIQDVIDDSLIYVIRRGLNEAEDERAVAIIFDMDTPGGRLDSAEEILKLLRGLSVPTYTFVNPNAISAGAIIAMATDHIYMTPGSKIGDAMPIMLSLFGEVQALPEAVQEKSVSYVAAMIRAAAQQKGHDPQLAEAMVRRDTEYKIGDELIAPKGRLLTLTNKDAERKFGPEKRPLLSEGTVTDIDDLLARIGMAGCRQVELKVTLAEEIARIIESFSVIILGLGLLGLYIEFKTPGFGLPGILGIALLAIWFWGSHIAGLAGMEEVILFLVGVILLIVEVVVFPGFGFLGIAGIGLIVLSLLLAMVEHYPGQPWAPTLPQFEVPLTKLSLALIFSFVGLLAVGRFLPKSQAFQRLILSAATHRDAGFQASPNTSHLLGLRGTAKTQLRPAGVALFGDKRMDVVTRGDFLESGAQIVIVETHGNRIIVEKAVNT